MKNRKGRNNLNKYNTKFGVIDRKIEMAKYAYRTVPIYMDILEKQNIDIEKISFDKLPIIDKSFYKDASISGLSIKYIKKYMQNLLIRKKTSGSSGNYLDVYWDNAEMKKSLLSLWYYRKKYYNISSADKLCFFTTESLYDIYCNEHIMAISKKTIYDEMLEEVYDKILEFNPSWMILQPSIAIILCKYIESNDLDVPSNLRYIEFTGEHLVEAVMIKTSQVFHCVIANQYGTKEVNSIAYECPEGNLHCMSENVFLEVLEEQELCVTTLQNKAMPLVRYKVGDRGEMINGKNCACGNCKEIIKLKAGRKGKWIVLKNDKYMPAYIVVERMNEYVEGTKGGIIQYQIIQKKEKNIDIKIVIGNRTNTDSINKNIKGFMHEIVGEDIEVKISICSVLIPDKETNKLALFVSEIVSV